MISTDEQPRNAKIDKIPTLKPAFRKDGTVTAANSSSISDGAAALVMMRRSEAEQRGLTPLAVITGHATDATGVLVVDFAPHAALTPGGIVFGWRGLFARRQAARHRVEAEFSGW